MTATEIIDKYEVPPEYFEAIFAAYEAGMTLGFIKGGINVITGETI